MERFTDKHMTESQITEIMELMNGEHAEALKLWAKRNENIGVVSGMIVGPLFAAMAVGSAKLAWTAAKCTWYTVKGYVTVCKDRLP